ncbi:hypothetical protein [Bradyrhizobium sp. URHC0002]
MPNCRILVGAEVDVCFATKATWLLLSSDMARWAKGGHSQHRCAADERKWIRGPTFHLEIVNAFTNALIATWLLQQKVGRSLELMSK